MRTRVSHRNLNRFRSVSGSLRRKRLRISSLNFTMSSAKKEKYGLVSTYYEIGDTLGKGSFSVVKKVKHLASGKSYALKVIDKQSVGADGESMIHAEVEILKGIRHQNIIYLREIFETKEKIFLVIELVEGGELFDRLVEYGSYSEKDAVFLMTQLLTAIDYLHSHDIVHRDLKADFGLSKVCEEFLLQTACAPEVLRCTGYGKEVDMWSSGVIMYILLCGYPPFYEENTAKLFEQILTADYGFPSPEWDDVSDSAKDLINRLLRVDPSERYTVKQALAHPWIVGKNASTTHRAGVIEGIRKFNARRKLKSAMIAVRGAVGLTSALSM